MRTQGYAEMAGSIEKVWAEQMMFVSSTSLGYADLKRATHSADRQLERRLDVASTILVRALLGR